MMSAEEMFEEQRYKRNEENENITYLQRFGSGYFKGIDDNELIGEILAKCEVV